MTSFYEVPVPGTFDRDVALIDLETSKVPAPAGTMNANGEPMRLRWMTEMAGIARDGLITIVDDGTEADRLSAIGEVLAGAREVRYMATREFDEMILRGRFTNARRSHFPAPVFPAMPGAEEANWKCLRCDIRLERGADVPSRDVPAYLASGRWEPVAVHLLRDIAELIVLAGNPDAECREWCELVLADRDAAYDAVLGGEPEL